jgi:hypothetical protein
MEPGDTPALTNQQRGRLPRRAAAWLLLWAAGQLKQQYRRRSWCGDNGAVAWYPGATYERTCQRERRSSVNSKDEHDHRPGELLAVDLHPIGVSLLGAEALGDASVGVAKRARSWAWHRAGSSRCGLPL